MFIYISARDNNIYYNMQIIPKKSCGKKCSIEEFKNKIIFVCFKKKYIIAIKLCLSSERVKMKKKIKIINKMVYIFKKSFLISKHN